MVRERVTEYCRQLEKQLEQVDFNGRRALLGVFGVRVEASRDDVSITVVLDPSLFTTVQTLACSSSSAYSFVIADLKEVISWDGRQKVVEFVPC